MYFTSKHNSGSYGGLAGMHGFGAFAGKGKRRARRRVRKAGRVIRRAAKKRPLAKRILAKLAPKKLGPPPLVDVVGPPLPPDAVKPTEPVSEGTEVDATVIEKAPVVMPNYPMIPGYAPYTTTFQPPLMRAAPPMSPQMGPAPKRTGINPAAAAAAALAAGLFLV